MDKIFKFSNIDNGSMYLDGQISYDNAAYFAAEMRWLAETNDIITIHINSPGGQVIGMYQIVATILQLQEAGITVNTVIDGMAASAAAVIAIMGQTIWIRDYGIVMFHVVQYEGDEDDEMKRVMELMNNSLITMLKGKDVDQSFIDSIMNGEDNWFDATEMMELGLVNMILETGAEKIETEEYENLMEVYNAIKSIGDTVSAPDSSIQEVAVEESTEEIDNKLEQLDRAIKDSKKLNMLRVREADLWLISNSNI